MELVGYLIGQSVVIIGAMVYAYVKMQISIAHLQSDVGHLGDVGELRAEAQKDLTDKVDGISRSVARLEGSRKAS